MIPKTARLLAWAAAGGCLGGGLNAAHALLTISEDLKWHIVPAGALHGGLLALLSLASARLLLRRPPWQGILGLPVLGWVCGYLTFFPLALSAGFDLPNFYLFRGSNLLDSPGFIWPYTAFGLVALIAAFLWGLLAWIEREGRAWHLAAGCLAGTLGSLWWWITWEHPFYSLLHGCVWGLLVGWGVLRAKRPSTAPSP